MVVRLAALVASLAAAPAAHCVSSCLAGADSPELAGGCAAVSLGEDAATSDDGLGVEVDDVAVSVEAGAFALELSVDGVELAAGVSAGVTLGAFDAAGALARATLAFVVLPLFATRAGGALSAARLLASSAGAGLGVAGTVLVAAAAALSSAPVEVAAGARTGAFASAALDT